MAPQFEQACLALCCSSPTFWARVGHALDHERMELKISELILMAVRLIVKDTGRGPRNGLLVLQRLQRFVAAGKLKSEAVEKVWELMEAADTAGLPDVEGAVQELLPAVKLAMRRDASWAALEERAKQGDFQSVSRMLEHADKLGTADVRSTVELGLGVFTAIDQMETGGRLPTGISDYDNRSGGGMQRGQLGVVLAESGAGKSMWLISQAATAVKLGLHVAVATLELSVVLQSARLMAHLTGVETKAILESSAGKQLAKSRWLQMEPHVGVMSVSEFPPHATSVRQLIEWLDEREQEKGRKVDVFVVDYGDKLQAPNVQEGNEYLAMRYVFEGLRRDIAHDRDCYVWTASQAARRKTKDRDRVLDLGDVADSMHKIRTADRVPTLKLDEDGLLTIFQAKDRTGEARWSVGPLPEDFARGRVVALASEWNASWTLS